LGARLGAAAAVDEASEGAKLVGDPTDIDVGFGSTNIPDDVLEDCVASEDAEIVLEVTVSSADDGVAAELAGLELGGCALVCGLALDAGGDGVAITGHSAATPMPFWKTPMMLVSPTSTSRHTLLTTSPIFFRPATHASLHLAVALGSKSDDWQPSMFVVYAARHCAFSMRMGWKLASWTADVVAAVVRMAKPSMAARSERCILWWSCLECGWAECAVYSLGVGRGWVLVSR